MTIAFGVVVVFMTLAVALVPLPIKAVNPPQLNDTTPITTNQLKDEIKCGECPCGTTCYSSPPPPPPCPPPPPPPKKPSPTPGVNCPPPPKGGSGHAPPDYIYITGPPKDLYPAVQSISAARRSFTVAPPLLVLFGLLGVLAF
ncbi:hypothetical protein L1987_06579 [Smallanthus sonchifolius]|uniref:Uncharacterized protein n=1 Tax=Smallanthus sonchifolius TaxID=185202 RepID=A0ACB9JYI6_9ASTR|nr:hypothetical protein L1987_06579 [Smallanthus sonchifolius]